MKMYKEFIHLNHNQLSKRSVLVFFESNQFVSQGRMLKIELICCLESGRP